MIISDPSSRGIETAEMIQKMIEVDKVMDCKQLGLIFNRVRGHEKVLEESAKKSGLSFWVLFRLTKRLLNMTLWGNLLQIFRKIQAHFPHIVIWQLTFYYKYCLGRWMK